MPPAKDVGGGAPVDDNGTSCGVPEATLKNATFGGPPGAEPGGGGIPPVPGGPCPNDPEVGGGPAGGGITPVVGGPIGGGAIDGGAPMPIPTGGGPIPIPRGPPLGGGAAMNCPYCGGA